jgi:hypothetical protein
LPAPALGWHWDVNERHAAMPATMLSARSMKALAQIARVHAKPRTGVWSQQVVGAPGVAFSVAMAPSRGSFDRQITKTTASRPSRVRRTGGWTSGDLLRLT